MDKRWREPVENFWRKVAKGPDCWLWQGSKNYSGYGLYNFRTAPRRSQQQVRAHRFSWELENGQIPEGMWVLHHCDTPGCVRPSHLFLGDNEANVADRGRKGRDPRGDKHWARTKPELVLRGDAHGRSKLNEDIVRELRRTQAPRGAPVTELSRRYGVSVGVMWRVLHRRSWKHVV